MKVEEIAVRQEVRQLLSEAGMDANGIKAFAEQAISEQIDKKLKRVFSQTNLDGAVQRKLNSYEFNELLRNTVASKVRDAVDISVDVNVSKGLYTEEECMKSLDVFKHPGRHICMEEDGSYSYSADMVRAFEIAISLLSK